LYFAETIICEKQSTGVNVDVASQDENAQLKPDMGILETSWEDVLTTWVGLDSQSKLTMTVWEQDWGLDEIVGEMNFFGENYIQSIVKALEQYRPDDVQYQQYWKSYYENLVSLEDIIRNRRYEFVSSLNSKSQGGSLYIRKFNLSIQPVAEPGE